MVAQVLQSQSRCRAPEGRVKPALAGAHRGTLGDWEFGWLVQGWRELA